MLGGKDCRKLSVAMKLSRDAPVSVSIVDSTFVNKNFYK